MNIRIFILILLFLEVEGVRNKALASEPAAYFSYATFVTAKGANYLETYLTFNGHRFRFIKNATNKYYGLAHVKVSFKQGDSVVASANYNVSSPDADDTVHLPYFTNVKRYWLKKGKYTMQVTIDDPNNPSSIPKGENVSKMVTIGYSSDSISVSDVEFITSYSPSAKPGMLYKCGYDLLPYPLTNFPDSRHELAFYCEIYNAAKVTGQNEKFLLKYAIESDGYRVSPEGFTAMTVLQADTVNPLMAKMNIDNLPSGSYRLVVSVVDRNNHLLTQRAFGFSRENSRALQNIIPASFQPYMATRDTLIESIRCLYPIAKGGERFYVSSDSLDFVKTAELRNFFYNFWVARDTIYPFAAWHKYLLDVEAVNNTFGIKGAIRGYKTDRGRVYLQYGPPSERSVYDLNPTSYPYEIWEYSTLPDGQVERKFVFYEPSPSTNNYVLLHSTAIGEVKNPRWQLMLNSRMGMPNSVDQMNTPDPMGENTLDNYSNPR